MAVKTVTYDLFDYHGTTSNLFSGWACTKIYEDSLSISAIKDYLYSAKVRLTCEEHELHLYFMPEGGQYEEILVVKKGETKEVNITQRVKASPQFKLKVDMCMGWHFYATCFHERGALILTYEDVVEASPYTGYTGEFPLGPVDLGMMFDFMMQFMFIMMFFSMMTAVMTNMAEAMTV